MSCLTGFDVTGVHQNCLLWIRQMQSKLGPKLVETFLFSNYSTLYFATLWWNWHQELVKQLFCLCKLSF